MTITTNSYQIEFSERLALQLLSLWLIANLAGYTFHEVRGVYWRAKYWIEDLRAAFWGLVATVTGGLLWMLGGKAEWQS